MPRSIERRNPSALLRALPRLALLALLPVGCQDSDVSRELGARCAASAECADRCLLEGDGYPGGFCTSACNTTSECPPASACVQREGGVCLFTCANDAACAFLGAGWRCVELDTREAPSTKVKACRG